MRNDQLDIENAVTVFAGLSHETRFRAFLFLIGAGSKGMVQSDLAARLSVPPQTLSFHLKEMSLAGLVSREKNGTFIIYKINPDTLKRITGFFILQNSTVKAKKRIKGIK